MLNLNGRSDRFCSGMTRRRFIQIGGLSTFGLTLSNLLRSEARANLTGDRTRSKKSVILIWQHGGLRSSTRST